MTFRQQGQDISIVAAELLARVLEWELQESEEAVAGIQHGLDNFVESPGKADAR
ncbi:MAG: hypothetical protein SW833_10625 [Cyanobacteriota bacterium]|nr:hypothetical protein [Cyanobacteriota bacterium]